MKIIKDNKGFTVTELLVYISIVTVAVLVFTSFMADVGKNAAKAKISQEVQQNASMILTRVTKEIRDGSNFVVTPDEISINNGAVKYTYDNASNSVIYQNGSIETLNTDKVRVTDLTFQQISNTINISLTVEQKNQNAVASASKQINLSTTVTPRSILY